MKGRPTIAIPEAEFTRLWNARPFVGSRRIADHFGVASTTVFRWARRLDLPRREAPRLRRDWQAAGGRAGKGTQRLIRRVTGHPRSAGPCRPKLWRCAKCGGLRDTVTPHECQPTAHAIVLGLRWERAG